MRLLLGGLPLQMPARAREDAVDLLGRGRKRDDEADEALVVAHSLLRQAEFRPGVIDGARGPELRRERLAGSGRPRSPRRPSEPHARQRREPFRKPRRYRVGVAGLASQWSSAK